MNRIPLSIAHAGNTLCWGLIAASTAIARFFPIKPPAPVRIALTILLLAAAALTILLLFAPLEREDERARINQGRAALVVIGAFVLLFLGLLTYLKYHTTILLDRQLLILCFAGSCTLYHGAFTCYDRFSAA